MWDMSWDASVSLAADALSYGQFNAVVIGIVVMVIMAIVYIKWELNKGA